MSFVRSSSAHWGTLVVLTVLSTAIVSCSGEESGGTDRGTAWTTTMSTSGDTTVARTTGVIPDSGTHILEEIWRVGDADALDSTITFGRVSAFAVHTDNTIAVFDPSAPTLRMFDANGAYIRTLGRKGSGPGEYGSANGLAFLPDGRLAIWDSPTSRVTVFTPTGDVDREWRPPVMGWGVSNAVSTSRRYALAIRAGIRDSSSGSSTGPSPMRGAHFFYDTAGRIVDTVAEPARQKEPAMLVSQTNGGIAMYSVPYTPGRPGVMLTDDRLAIGEGDTYRIHVSGGSAPLRIEREAVAVAVRSEERDQQRAVVERAMMRNDPKWSWNGPQIPSVKPLVNTLLSGADGRLWVRVSAPGELIPEAERDEPRAAQPNEPAPIVIAWREPTWYDVFETDGRFLGRIVMPARSTWLGARGNLVWGVTRDENDVPFVTQWRISPSWSSR